MNRTLMITILFFVTNFILAQSIDNLDLKNGFRHLKLGSSPSQIKNIVKQEYQFSRNVNVVTYDYVGNDIENIFNVKTEGITLSFFKSKLFSISITFGNLEQSRDFEKHEFDNLLSALESTYGSDWFSAKNNEGIILNGVIWDGKNVKLELLRLDFSKSKTRPSDYGFISGVINVYDKKITSEMYSSDF